MNRLGKTAAIILATLLLAVTPVVAFADVGTKTARSIQEAAILTQVDDLLEGDAYNKMSHGEVVSSAASMDLQDLITLLKLELKPTEKLTRGQIIRVFAHQAATGNSVEVKDAPKANSEDTDKEKKNEDKLTGQARADANRSAPTDTDTEDEKDKGEKKDNQGRQNANARGNTDLDVEGTDITSDDETVSRGQGQGRGNQNR